MSQSTIQSSQLNFADRPDLLAGAIDHTLLTPTASSDQIVNLCSEAVQYGFHSVCIHPTFVSCAAHELASHAPVVATVISFPFGLDHLRTKEVAVIEAIRDGAGELDVVLNYGAVLAGQVEAAIREIGKVVQVAESVPVKVILETGYLNDEQIRFVTKGLAEVGASQIKTSTGFGPRGASVADVELIVEALGSNYPKVGIKASGGIRTWQDCQALAAAGATRFGLSASVKVLDAFGQHCAK